MPSPIVTLTTDWGYNDFFAGMVKGRLYSSIPEVRVVDITHGLAPYDLLSAPFMVQNSCMTFPEGTIHIIDVLSEENENQGFVVVYSKGQYFICANNGLPYMVFKDDYDKVVEINPMWSNESYNFAAYEIFCPVAQKLALGVSIDEIGSEAKLYEQRLLLYMHSNDLIQTHVFHIDHYGNAYLDIRYNDFIDILNGRRFEISFNLIATIRDVKFAYADCERPSLTVSDLGYLEVAMYKGRASDILGIRPHDIVKIRIK